MTTIIPARLERLSELPVYSGSHKPPSNPDRPEGCAMELASWVSGCEWSDEPPCTDSRLARLVQAVNDGIKDDNQRAVAMRRLIPLVVDTAGREVEVKALLDRLAVRRLRETVLPLAPTWPDPVRDEVVSAIKGVCEAFEGRRDMLAAQSTARSVARSAAKIFWLDANSANSADHAATSAAWPAIASSDVSATRSAQSAARSVARSAQSAARSVARSAAWLAEADRLATELEAFHTQEGDGE